MGGEQPGGAPAVRDRDLSNRRWAVEVAHSVTPRTDPDPPTWHEVCVPVDRDPGEHDDGVVFTLPGARSTGLELLRQP